MKNTVEIIEKSTPSPARPATPQSRKCQRCVWIAFGLVRTYIYIYYNIIVLMGIPAGGSRPIAPMPMLYRLWTKIRRPYIIKWELAHQGPWNAAVKGSSALRAGILSLLRDEMAIRLGLDSLVALWDIDFFYIDICILMVEAEKVEYSIQVHY